MAAAACKTALLAIVAAVAGCAAPAQYVSKPLSTADIVQVPLESAPWHISAIGGRETPMTGNYSMRFADGRISAQFGCNKFNGQYRLVEGVVYATDVIATVAGCFEPARSFERLGDAILAAPMQLGMNPETGGPVLFNGKGRIDLVPMVTGTRI